MRPEERSQRLLDVLRSKAKMHEFSVPKEHHIDIPENPTKLFTISIGLTGDFAVAINRGEFDPEISTELRNKRLFSAKFFDSYLQSKLNNSLDPYLKLLGSASYYLCDHPGNASVLAKRIDNDFPDLNGEGLEDLLRWLLQDDLETHINGFEGPFGEYINGISRGVLQFFKDGTGEENLIDLATKLKDAVYEFGTPRQLLFGDMIAAVLRKKLQNSSWKALPLYSGLPCDKWLHALQKGKFIKELWPAQHLLGKAGVFKGESAIVQMPTSAGKTKATELILRSALLAERVKLAIIIAPFRALCHEIKNSLVNAFRNETTKVDELTDALQTDFDPTELLKRQQVLVVTPEKLLYVLRRAPTLAYHIGLLVFDEGHQFDNGTRGITYELLLTSLRSMIPKGTQKVLISAVISNAEAIGEWLNGEPNVVEGTALIPTFRSVGFASWRDQLGRIEYVYEKDMDRGDFFVPRVIEKLNLRKKGKERKERFFPKKYGKQTDKQTVKQTIALYLGLKLALKGSVAVFCGRKSTVTRVCKKAVDIVERGVSLTLPLEFSDKGEVKRLKNLYVENLGEDAPTSLSAQHGIFTHHGNTPHGIRLAVEYAMRENLVRFVVCTSTLAQGVNLPIRYLIVTDVYQGRERIKVRDFHNLIGRAGRAGMHTEGSILFADPAIYDKRKAYQNKWRWEQVKELFEPSNSEPCISNLLSIFKPIKNGDEKYSITKEALDFVKAYISDPNEIAKWAARIDKENVERQVVERISLICAVESFLLSHWDETGGGLSEEDVLHLSEKTLGFFLADHQQKEHIRELFQLLSKNISENITNPVRRKAYGRTLYGVQDARAIEKWAQSNADKFLPITNDDEKILELTWPLLTDHINNRIFRKFDKPEVLKKIAHGWIGGKSFSDLLKITHECKTKKKFTIDRAVEVCEGIFAYDGALLVGALCEIIEMLVQEKTGKLIGFLQLFQKRLKYGLPTETTINLYELGFSDRVIVQDLAASMKLSATQKKKELIKTLKQDQDAATEVIKKYPGYFQERMNELLQK